MVITKKGNINKTAKLFVCPECECEFEANASEYTRCEPIIEVGTFDEVPVSKCECPLCGAIVERIGK